MSARELPPRPDLEQYRKQAKDLLKGYRAGDSEALRRVKRSHPRVAGTEQHGRAFVLADAQWVIAREHGFESWPKFVSRIQEISRQSSATTGPTALVTTQLGISSEEVYACSFNADGTRVLVGAEGNPVALWDIATGESISVLDDTSVRAWALRWSVDQGYALVGGNDSVVRLWHLQERRCVRALEGHRGVVRCVDMSPDLTRAVSACGRRDPAIRFWNVEEQRCLRVLEGHRDGVYSVAFDSSISRALSGSRDGTVRLWDLETGRCIRVLTGHTYHVHYVAWSTDQRYALSCSRDIRLWDLQDGRCLSVLSDHTDTIRTVVWTQDQRRLLSAAHDGTVRLWDAERGSSLQVLGHSVGLVGAALVAKERRVASCDWGGQVNVWELAQ